METVTISVNQNYNDGFIVTVNDDYEFKHDFPDIPAEELCGVLFGFSSYDPPFLNKDAVITIVEDFVKNPEKYYC